MQPSRSTKLLALHDISKSYPGVKALQNVSFDVHSGEVVGLIGENGAGKSTLVKMLGGAIQPDAGEIDFENNRVSFVSTIDAQKAGISVIYQEFNLVPHLTAVENIFLGTPKSRFGWIHKKRERAHARQLFNALGVDIDLSTPVGKLSIAHQQTIEIAKALTMNAKMLILDEPTAALSSAEADKLFAIIGDLKQKGLGIVYVSHRLEEISQLSDRVIVLRDGKMVADRIADSLNRNSMIELMVGRTIENEFPHRERHVGRIGLETSQLTDGDFLAPIDIAVRRGEVLGIAGLVGSGRTELARLIFGADNKAAGTVTVDGKTQNINCPLDAIRAGICLLTEDRKSQGLITQHSLLANFGLPNLNDFAVMGWLQSGSERNAFKKKAQQLNLKHSSLYQPANSLSGGNQQKLVLAKWLQRNCDIFIFDEPTRGIDVGARFEVYQLINELVQQNKCIILISSEIPEVLGMCDRIIVMRSGALAGEITDPAHATQEHVMELAS
jgi:ribose transport system ATP-binding protein